MDLLLRRKRRNPKKFLDAQKKDIITCVVLGKTQSKEEGYNFELGRLQKNVRSKNNAWSKKCWLYAIGMSEEQVVNA